MRSLAQHHSHPVSSIWLRSAAIMRITAELSVAALAMMILRPRALVEVGVSNVIVRSNEVTVTAGLLSVFDSSRRSFSASLRLVVVSVGSDEQSDDGCNPPALQSVGRNAG